MDSIVIKVDKNFNDNDMAWFACTCGKEKEISLRVNIDNVKCECGKTGYWYTVDKWRK